MMDIVTSAPAAEDGPQAALAATRLSATRLSATRLSATVVAITLSLPRVVDGAVTPLLDGEPLGRPHLISRFDDNRRRLVLARAPDLLERGGLLTVRTADGVTIADAPVHPDDTAGLEPLLDFLRDLTAGERGQALLSLFDGAPALFRQQQDDGYAATCRAIADHLFPAPGTPAPAVAAAPGIVLCQGAIPPALGTVEAVIVFGATRVWRNPFALSIRASGPDADAFDLLLGLREGGRPPASFLIVGSGGLCHRRVRAPSPRRLVEWLTDPRVRPHDATRRYLFQALGGIAATSRTAAGVLRDAQLLAPLPPRDHRDPAHAVGAGIDIAHGHGTGGLFVKGWLRDPHGAVERIVAVGPDGGRRTLGPAMVRFPRPDVEAVFAGSPHRPADADIGFAAFTPGSPSPYPVHQYRFELVLDSGGVLDLVPPVTSADPRQARDDLLAAVPLDRLTPAVVEAVLATPMAALQDAILAGRRPPEIVTIGTPPAAPPANPVVSLIVPLYRNLDYLRFQVAALALDPAMAGAELVYVLDSPEQRGQVEHLLRLLGRLYGLPMTLVVMSDNFGFSSACNAGAAAARADALLFVNSDVLPAGPGWMAPLLAVLAAHPRVAMAGPKLLFDDDSLQHAGLYFAREGQGPWYNHHYFKGYPRDFAPATVARLVPGVTAAAMLVRRAVFEAVGGFDEGYVVGDFEDSDLCLKVREAGHEIAYVPAAELYHYERRSIEAHPGYTRTAANAYNQWRHDRRWAALMAAVMERRWPTLDDLPESG